MRPIFLLVVVSLLLVTVRANMPQQRDVCILGSGASGMFALSELYKRGYSVQLFEQNDVIGGYCNTETFQAPPGAPINTLEIGVQEFSDTKLLTEVGFGNWMLDFKAWALTFLPAYQVISFDLTHPEGGNTFLTDLKLGLQFPTPTANPNQTLAFEQAFEVFFAIVSQYPWLDSTVYPDPIPAELLVPFSDFIVAHNLQAMTRIFQPLLFVGGMGHYANITTLYALKNMHRGVLALFSVPGSGITLLNGCGSLYNAVRNYVGYDKVITGVTVLDASRHECWNHQGHGEHDDFFHHGDGGCEHNDDSMVALTVKLPSGEYQSYSCGSLFVTFAPVMSQAQSGWGGWNSNIAFLHPDQHELNILSKVQHRAYYAFEVNVAGPAAAGAFNIYNLDPQNYDGLPVFPAISALQRTIPYGPAAGWASADTDLSIDQITAVIADQLTRMPATVLNQTSLVTVVSHVPFQPHFSVADLSVSPSPYTRLAQLQGYRDTYWLGSMLTFAESVMVMEHALRLINATFPPLI